MWSDTGCLVAIFLMLTCVVTTLALRSLWKARHEPPLTPWRIVLLVLLIIGGGITAIALRADGLLVPMVGAVFLVSVSWLIDRGL